LNAGDDRFGIAGFAKNPAGFFSVKGLEGGAPLQIARPRHGTGLARDHPPAKVLAAGGQAQGLRSLRAQLHHPGREPMRVEQLARPGAAFRLLGVGIGGVGFVEPPDGFAEARRIGHVGEEGFSIGHEGRIREGRRNCERRLDLPAEHQGGNSPQWNFTL